MECPRDATTLEPAKLDGLSVQQCPRCEGAWLDAGELSQLESTVEPDPDWRVGTIEWSEQADKMRCPVCGEEMESFNYRDDGVQLDTCKERHGYWLDAGEDRQVRHAMKDRVADLKHARKEEVKWGAFVYKLSRPSWLDRLDHFLKGSV